ncbi:hypothetical protein NEOC95_000079 [Neochlamydia sp. AcF95]|nr:hypothetical protein [Neochlamydia sp. AcF95]
MPYLFAINLFFLSLLINFYFKEKKEKLCWHLVEVIAAVLTSYQFLSHLFGLASQSFCSQTFHFIACITC